METTDAIGKRFLFASWEGGGNIPPMLAVIRRLIARGHIVRVIGDPCNRTEFEAAGASFISWQQAPARQDKSQQSDPLRDWAAKGPPDILRRLSDYLFVGTALARAQDVLAALKSFPADAVVTSEVLLGVMAAAESAGVPCAALAANVYLFPLPGVPPFGPGFLPARTVIGKFRDFLVRSISMRLVGRYTPQFNAARHSLGLKPLRHPFEQLARVKKVLVQTSQSFDFPARLLPENVKYIGPEIEDPDWVDPWVSPWPQSDRRPLVLVAFSTTFQDQHASLTRVIEALAALPVRAVVTSGPAIDAASLPAAENVHVCQTAPHAQLLEEAALVITHAGHGTVLRALAAGVPMLCLPMGRDQNDNAARVVARRAGLRLSPRASVSSIRTAAARILHDPAYRDAAQRLGAKILDDVQRSRGIDILEELAANKSAATK